VKRLGLAGVVAAAALALPASAWAHAALLQTVPVASRTINTAPTEVRLRFSEPVEPRFAIVSVTDAAGRQVTDGDPAAAPGSPQTLVTPLRSVPEGWYLVFWRVISADGHPVRGAFTFAVGPNPGPPPQFRVPSLSETATTTQLLIARWFVFLSTMSALGLFVLRAVIARPVVRVVRGCSLRSLNIAFAVALGVALVATPIYALLATAQFTLRSFWDFGDVIPAVRSSGFGEDFLDLELVLGLFAIAAIAALVVDRPEREQRSVAELLALPAALAAGLAALVLPALAGHAGQKSPRGLSLPLDTAHLTAGSIWLGGLIGLVVFWFSVGRAGRAAALAYIVPRFSVVAFCSVLLLIGTGIGQAFQELPTFASLWETSYGQALIWKIGLLSAALLLAAVNLARTKPRLQARDASAPLLLRRLVQGEILFVAAALFAAGVLASLAPPSSALARVQDISARVGPGPVSEKGAKGPYRVHVRVTPNRAAVNNAFELALTRNGRPVRGAEVVTKFDMLDMEMGEQSYRLRERRPGVFRHSAPALVMVGHWGLLFEVTPPGGRPFVVTLLDKASG
jgi:copper transport protein